MNTTVSPVKRGWSRGDKALIWVVGTVVVLAALAAVWMTRINALPSVTIPTPTLPSPNAFDYFTAAGNGVVDSDKIGRAITKPRPLSHNPAGRAYPGRPSRPTRTPTPWPRRRRWCARTRPR